MPNDPTEPSPHLSDYYREQDRLRRQREAEARAAADLRREQRERFDRLTGKLLDRAEALLDTMASARQPAAKTDDLSLTAARRQLAHIVRAPHFCSRKLCRRTKACCGEPRHCLAVMVPLLPPQIVEKLVLALRPGTRRRKPAPAIPAAPSRSRVDSRSC